MWLHCATTQKTLNFMYRNTSKFTRVQDAHRVTQQTSEDNQFLAMCSFTDSRETQLSSQSCHTSGRLTPWKAFSTNFLEPALNCSHRFRHVKLKNTHSFVVATPFYTLCYGSAETARKWIAVCVANLKMFLYIFSSHFTVLNALYIKS